MNLFKRFTKSKEINETVVEDEIEDGDYIIKEMIYKPIPMTQELQRRKEEERIKSRYGIGVREISEQS